MQKTPAQQDAPPIVGVIDPDPVARNGLRALLHGLGIDVTTFDSAENYLLAADGRQLLDFVPVTEATEHAPGQPPVTSRQKNSAERTCCRRFRRRGVERLVRRFDRSSVMTWSCAGRAGGRRGCRG